jgi:hypothetical protein
MDNWFDGLAKDTARGLSRRQAIGRLAGGMAMAALGLLGIRQMDSQNCGKLCEECCRNNFPRGGQELGECIRLCHQGQGICGPIVCPQD